MDYWLIVKEVQQQLLFEDVHVLVHIFFGGWRLVQILWNIDPESTFWASWIFFEAGLLPAAVASETAAVVALRDLNGVLLNAVLAEGELRHGVLLADNTIELLGLLLDIRVLVR